MIEVLKNLLTARHFIQQAKQIASKEGVKLTWDQDAEIYESYYKVISMIQEMIDAL